MLDQQKGPSPRHIEMLRNIIGSVDSLQTKTSEANRNVVHIFQNGINRGSAQIVLFQQVSVKKRKPDTIENDLLSVSALQSVNTKNRGTPVDSEGGCNTGVRFFRLLVKDLRPW